MNDPAERFSPATPFRRQAPTRVCGCKMFPLSAGSPARRAAKPRHAGALGRVQSVLLPAALALMLPGGAAASINGALAHCAAITSSSARLACFDALAADVGAPAPVGVSSAAGVADPVARAGADAARPMSVEGRDGASPSERPATADAPSVQSGGEREALTVRLYRRNYLLPVSYNSNVNRNVPEQESIDIPFFGDGAFDDVEVKFQLSFEVPVWTRIAGQPLDLYFGYTQLAFFQAYNREYSSPFRETNYEPELGLHWQPRVSAMGWRLRSVRAAVNHQSNGRSEPLSRSWNRFTGEAVAERGNLDLSLRLWTLLGANPSDNPDIDEYLGFGELRAGYDLGKHHLGMMVRSVRHPTVQLDWSYPLGDGLRVYAQYFNGFGESLLDYDHSVNRIGVGFALNDWP